MVSLEWKEINAYVRVKKTGYFWRRRPAGELRRRQILNSISGHVGKGAFLAILGPSGAGKTTLLNVLSKRNHNDLEVHGDVLVNGCAIGRLMRDVGAFCQQKDIFIERLTPEEHLWFHAVLRLGNRSTLEECKAKVAYLLQKLGLVECAKTMIGGIGEEKALSGGERKRLNFATEILNEPKILFCDEPTTGLDAYMAEQVINMLKALSGRAKSTIICTIHQPSSEVFGNFDNILLMAEGRRVFLGSREDAATYFEEIGHRCPETYNPADHYIAVLTETQEGDIDSCIQNLKEVSQDGLPEPSSAANKELFVHFEMASTWRQWRALLWRCWITSIRDNQAFKYRASQLLMLAVLIGAIEFQQVYDQRGVRNIVGVLYLMQALLAWNNAFAALKMFNKEFATLQREYHTRLYTAHAYYLCRVLVISPLYILLPTVWATILYWIVGLRPEFTRFLVTVFTIQLFGQITIAYGCFMSMWDTSLTVIINSARMYTTFANILSGAYLVIGSIPAYLQWAQYLSWYRFSNEILIVNQWEGVQILDCESVNQSTCYKTGSDVIRSLSYDEDKPFAINLCLMFVIGAVWQLGGYLLMRHKLYKNR